MKEMNKEEGTQKAANATTLQKNIETITALEKKSLQRLSPIELIADKVTVFAGSAPFLLTHLIWFGGWLVVNCGLIPGIKPFDPYPFSFLTLVVSLEAIFLTLLVLMSQNRMTKEADKRAQLDLQINLLDEQETTLILRMVQKIANHLGLKEEMDEVAQELCEETDVNRVAMTIDENAAS